MARAMARKQMSMKAPKRMPNKAPMSLDYGLAGRGGTAPLKDITKPITAQPVRPKVAPITRRAPAALKKTAKRR